MVNTKTWLSMRHFVTNEYLNDIYMGQQQYEICNTDIITNGLLDNLNECTIFASTLVRSRQTVEYVVSEFRNIKFNVVFLDKLNERGLGDFEGKQKFIIRQNTQFFKNGKLIVEKTPPNGEKLIDFRFRVNLALEIIRDEFKNKSILVISHLQVLRMIRFCMLEKNDYTHWHDINYTHGEIVRECYGERKE